MVQMVSRRQSLSGRGGKYVGMDQTQGQEQLEEGSRLGWQVVLESKEED